jgi:hypothetical protein
LLWLSEIWKGLLLHPTSPSSVYLLQPER